ncbi:Xaa-Pro peptidase family protein [Pantoea sp. BAV 3049]|uniref:M24 family metallopeptidase n=1 Tax=Pantoea sp. BAV 3049 TaxID=2654188 RepID=UPI00131D39AB|nr:M24 family metallopeptidase [Pantoea sp. BAV 3049]
MSVSTERFKLTVINAPATFPNVRIPAIADDVMASRKQKVLAGMAQNDLDFLVIYADKEHGGNFEYLAGFIPRFEEALLTLNAHGELTYIMGNENLKLVPYARNQGKCLHAPAFSLPNQPMDNERPLVEVLAAAGLQPGSKTGVAGWKLFTSQLQDNATLFDVPAFILDAVIAAAGNRSAVVNATPLFTSPAVGARRINTASEITFYEYGANLASTRILKALDSIEPGKSEKEIGQLLSAEGQPGNVVMVAATGDRFANACLYPSDKLIRKGDKFSLTVGYKGGLSSRAAYVVASESELPAAVADYLPALAIPYYQAVTTWLETLRTGLTGGELYQTIETVLPKAKYHWHLNPGHLVADEEWLCSPVYPQSAIELVSGMIFQIDIIPSLPGYAGCSIEDTVALADASLRQQLQDDYPEVWQRMETRKVHLRDVLNIHVSEDVLPLSNTVGYLRPFLLDKTRALVRQP